MSVEKSGSKPLAIMIYGLLVCIGVALAYFELRGTFPMAGDVVLPLAYVLVVRRGAFLPRGQDGQPRFGLGIKIADLAKSLICFVAAVLWAGIAASMTSDTPAGNAVVGVPSLAILGIGAFFFFQRLFQPDSPMRHLIFYPPKWSDVLRGLALILIISSMFAAAERAGAANARTVADVQCILVGARLSESPDQGQRLSGEMLLTYFLGRIDGRSPSADLETLITREAQKMTIYGRIVGVLLSVGIWLAIKALLWCCLLELLPLGVCHRFL